MMPSSQPQPFKKQFTYRIVWMALICRTKSWEEEEVEEEVEDDCPDDVRKTSLWRAHVSGWHVSSGWGWVYSKYWLSIWEATEVQRQDWRLEKISLHPSSLRVVSLYLQLFGDPRGGWGRKALPGDGSLAAVHLSCCPSERCSMLGYCSVWSHAVLWATDRGGRKLFSWVLWPIQCWLQLGLLGAFL